MANKKKLGKGLSEIFGDNFDSFLDEISNGTSDIKASQSEIAIKEIRPNPYQPRKQFDKQALQELADSITQYGVLQPIVVRKAVSGYDLIAGERRLRASKLAGKTSIPAVIVDLDDQKMMEISLLENIQREDLTPIEEANAYNQLIRKYHYTQEDLAKQLGKSRANIANLLRMLNLPKEVQKLVNDNKLSYSQARTILSLENSADMIEVANQAVAEELTVKQIEKLCKKITKKPSPVKSSKSDPFMDDVIDRLQKKYSTKVEIKNKSINIKYNDVEDLNRILEIMGLIED
ncbi:MAG: ParB/RepB/Spo0J family partition protein [Erysipelotrichaceae bacterium]|nr:ParB/RepB/Spo0J family partition protein [Erysipelotrichaceae bacterium]